MRKEDLKEGDVYCAKMVNTGKIVEATLINIDNGFGQSVLQRKRQAEILSFLER